MTNPPSLRVSAPSNSSVYSSERIMSREGSPISVSSSIDNSTSELFQISNSENIELIEAVIVKDAPEPKPIIKHKLKFALIGPSVTDNALFMSKYISGESTIPATITHSLSTMGMAFSSKLIERDGEISKIQMYLTAGQARFGIINKTFFRGADGILFIYDVANKNSFEIVQKWIINLKMYSDNDVKMVLIGTNCNSENRAVEKSEVTTFARTYRVPFLESCFSSGLNVEESFDLILNKCLPKI